MLVLSDLLANVYLLVLVLVLVLGFLDDNNLRLLLGILVLGFLDDDNFRLLLGVLMLGLLDNDRLLDNNDLRALLLIGLFRLRSLGLLGDDDGAVSVGVSLGVVVLALGLLRGSLVGRGRLFVLFLLGVLLLVVLAVPAARLSPVAVALVARLAIAPIAVAVWAELGLVVDDRSMAMMIVVLGLLLQFLQLLLLGLGRSGNLGFNISLGASDDELHVLNITLLLDLVINVLVVRFTGINLEGRARRLRVLMLDNSLGLALPV
ncbi:hypothetical protein HG530_013491 [Fusarium avenaceum]|nr:hypothetical protein HG530_013491 [Fusarium avenaceum]